MRAMRQNFFSHGRRQSDEASEVSHRRGQTDEPNKCRTKKYRRFVLFSCRTRNIDFDKKYSPTTFLFGYPNTVIFYSGCLVSQR